MAEGSKNFVEKGDVRSGTNRSASKLTHATSCLEASQIFQLDLITDFCPRVPEPCQEGLAISVERVHVCV